MGRVGHLATPILPGDALGFQIMIINVVKDITARGQQVGGYAPIQVLYWLLPDSVPRYTRARTGFISSFRPL